MSEFVTNAELRIEAERLCDENDQIKAENAKLRELVRDIYVDMWNYGEWLEPYEQRMRELGIEADDA